VGSVHALFNTFAKLSPVQLFENLWKSFLKQTTWVIDTATISAVSVPGKPLFLCCKHTLIAHLVFSLLASGNKLLPF